MKHPSNLRMLFATGLAAFSVLAQGQHHDSHSDPEVRAWLKQAASLTDQADRILATARIRIKEGRYDAVVGDCDRAIELYTTVGNPEAAPAHEVLAEYYLAMGKYSEALKESSVRKSALGLRLNMTRALALIGLNRLDDAGDLVTEELGTAQEPKNLRKAMNLWEVPWDRSSSVRSLKATAYIVRAANASMTGNPDVQDDIESALKLAPQNPSAELLLGGLLYRHAHYKDAVERFEIAEKLGRKSQTIEAARSLKRLAQEAASKGSS